MKAGSIPFIPLIVPSTTVVIYSLIIIHITFNNYDFNFLNYQYLHFGISSFIYIRTILNMIFLVNML